MEFGQTDRLLTSATAKMSKGPLILWLVIELGRLCLTPVASQIVVRAFLGQPVTLPCTYPSWSPHSNSMCWGKGQCPNSRCNDELLYTDGTRVVTSKSPKYQLRGIIQRGDVSLTIINTNENDQSVYCCRIEVPGWFNDVKMNIRLDLRRAPTTTRLTTTRRPTTTTTTTAMTTATTELPTTVVSPSDLTSTPPLQMGTTAALTATASVCPLTTLSLLPEEDTTLLTLEPSTKGPILTAEPKPALLPRTSQRSIEATSHRSTALFTSKAPETSFLVQNEVEPEQIRMTSNYELLMIIAPSLGFVLLALLLAFFLRGKFMKANCFQKHTRLDNAGEAHT
ncbi:T-cell immunoglobulin and mucin domain-containing protein 4 isoform X2 [Oryx dammah]|uniref:T-cell immunoglobulin and mucin domain-containing protein 4 isoform X2 n=1 Tax=Oryx dammah TaxID=59534 RepID=UPI001A9BA5AA|nr:T-cell immunoglobulin and mucin domain-containing protein 4 isoform X2 [Oryx dammah]